MTEAWTDIRKRVEILKDAERTGADLSPKDFDLMAFYDDAVVLLAVARASRDLIEVTDRLARTDYQEGSVGWNFIEGQRNLAWSKWEDALAALPENLK